MFAVKKGYQNGVFCAIYNLLSSIASIAAVGLGFYIPFSALGAAGGTLGFTEKIVNFVAGFAQGKIATLGFPIPETVYGIIGKVAAGLLYSIVLVAVMAVLTNLLRKCVNISYNNSAFHVFDGVFGVLLGIATCAVVLAAIFFVLLFMEKMDWYSSASSLFEGTEIFDIFYKEFGKIAGGTVDKIVEKVAAFLPR
jgi:hypothetical protein